MRRPGFLAVAALGVAAAGAGWWVRTEGGPAAATPAVRPATSHQCSMHPQVVSEGPGQCPICGMTLSRVEPEPSPTPAGEAADHAHASFSLAPERVQAIGVRTAAVEFRDLYRAVRTAGRVAFDPDLYGILTDYREVVVAQRELRESAAPEARARADGLRRALAVRLGLLGLSFGQLDAVTRVDADPASLLLPGQSAWIYAQVYEQPPYVPRPGQAVTVTAPALPGRTFRGQVVTVDSVNGPASRGVRVRALVATPGGGLRPEMVVHLVVELPLGRRLALPEHALLDTGTRRLVFVRRADGRFEPRDVIVGAEAEDYYEVLTGLAPGEQVVTAANFLIDSESRFRAALAAFGDASPAP